jgi:hypothetical protein
MILAMEKAECQLVFDFIINDQFHPGYFDSGKQHREIRLLEKQKSPKADAEYFNIALVKCLHRMGTYLLKGLLVFNVID